MNKQSASCYICSYLPFFFTPTFYPLSNRRFRILFIFSLGLRFEHFFIGFLDDVFRVSPSFYQRSKETLSPRCCLRFSEKVATPLSIVRHSSTFVAPVVLLLLATCSPSVCLPVPDFVVVDVAPFCVFWLFFLFTASEQLYGSTIFAKAI